MPVAPSPLPKITDGLYEIATASRGPAALGSPEPQVSASYFLTQSDPGPSQQVTLESAWQDLPGWFLFLAAEITPGDAAAFVTAARSGLPPLSTSAASPCTLVWLQAVDPAAVVGWLPLEGGDGLRSPIARQEGPYPFTWTPLSLLLDAGASVTLDDACAALVIATVAGDTTAVQLVSGARQSNWYSWYPEDAGNWSIELPLTGPTLGAFQTRLAIDFGVFLADLGCEVRYVQEDRSGSVTTLAFPVFAPQPLGDPKLGFLISLHPILATDTSCSRLVLDLGGASPPNCYQTQSAALRGGNFMTPTGGAITLGPAAWPQAGGAVNDAGPGPGPAGFGLCVGPAPGGSPTATQFYLAPVGTFEITDIDTPLGSPEPQGPSQLMCGLTGLEYLETGVGAAIGLRGAMPARSPAPSADAAPSLDATYTTSWLEYPLPPQGAAGAPGATPPRFFGQPSASVYFGTAAAGDFAHPVQAQLAILDAPCVFPLAPMGGVDPGNAAAIAALEAEALAGERHARLTAASPGPVFLPPVVSARRGSARPGAGDPPQTAETRQGFVVHINDASSGQAGTWASVDLALSPEFPTQRLRLIGEGSPGVVPKPIASQLLREELFLVVSNADALGDFANEISIAGFTFRLDIGDGSPVGPDSTILIFKYNTTTSLRTLVSSQSLWASPDVFVRDPQGTYDQIQLALAAAQSSPTVDDPFANFRQILDDPSWTGMIALNCAIDGNAMPPDLQMLLGGINGQLRAHHLGLQGNTLQTGDAGAAIAQSSLFGVISYPSPTQPLPPVDTTDDFAYVLELLTVVFENSKVQDLKVRVGLTVNRLFGREVQLVGGPTGASMAAAAGSPASNTLEIDGRYQIQDGVARVTFSSQQAFVYQFPVPKGASRVLRQVAFDRASLVPVSSTPVWSPAQGSPSPVAVKARFNLAGGVWFNPEPFAQAPGLDLFSYGMEPTSPQAPGLALDGLAVNIAFTLDGEGAIEGAATVTGDLADIRLTGAPGAIRPDSLLSSLPLQLTKFLCNEAGFTAASIGATAVHVLQLEPAPASTSPPAPAAPSAGPNITVAPQYGLEFDMPLGSLGVLSSATVGLMAKLVLGWGASRLTPQTDAVAVLVQLPQAFAGYGSFQLQGILKTVFGDANLLMVELDGGEKVYAVLFNNIQLSVLGKTFPPGVVIDFLIFSGQGADAGSARNENNLAWFLGVTQDKPAQARLAHERPHAALAQ